MEVEVAIREWLLMLHTILSKSRIFKLEPRWGKRINVFGDYVDK